MKKVQNLRNVDILVVVLLVVILVCVCCFGAQKSREGFNKRMGNNANETAGSSRNDHNQMSAQETHQRAIGGQAGWSRTDNLAYGVGGPGTTSKQGQFRAKDSGGNYNKNTSSAFGPGGVGKGPGRP